MQFSQHTIDVAPGLLPEAGVLSLDALRVTADATSVAQRIRGDALAAAQAEHRRASEQSHAQLAQRQAETLAQADTMLAALGRLEQDFFDQAASTVTELAQALFLRLAGELAPAGRASALLHQLHVHAPARLVDPVLRVHPDDAAAFEDGARRRAWRLDPDPALDPGCCRLEAASGAWCCAFDAAVLALGTSLQLPA